MQTWQLPGLTPSSSGGATRFAQRASCCSWSKDGKLLAAASDDGQVKLITVPENKVSPAAAAAAATARSVGRADLDNSTPKHHQQGRPLAAGTSNISTNITSTSTNNMSLLSTTLLPLLPCLAVPAGAACAAC
jgi:WD40 repeat protein